MIFSDFLKKKIIYQQHDLVKNPPLNYGKFDLIACRNVLIYMNQSLQTKILSGYHEQLANLSYLLLGINESILGASSLKYKKKGSVYIKA
jgi:two-component system CheB/CheR fusion protein